MITFKHNGNFDDTKRFLVRSKDKDYRSILDRYGREGVSVLSLATPKDTSNTSNSWDYEVTITKRGLSIYWTNSSVAGDVPVVILLHYGHATRSGSFVKGEDFINPAIRPIFDKLVDNLWKEVINL